MSSNNSRDPMWYCHNCHAEMRPLMAPDPVCASCHSSFVEMLEDDSDDPRQDAIPLDLPFFSNNNNRTRHRGDDEVHDPPGRPVDGFFDLLSNAFRSPTVNGNEHRQGDGMRTGGYTMVFDGPGGMRTVRVGGQQPGEDVVGGDRSGINDREGQNRVPSLFEYLASTTNPGSQRAGAGNANGGPARAPASLLASFILASLLRNSRGELPPGFIDPMGAGGRFGDYVLNEESLQTLLTELMAAGGGPVEPPTPQEVMDNLPRVIFEDGNPVFNETCSVCHEPFNPALAASPDADTTTSDAASSSSSPSSPASKAPETSEHIEQLGITLPCKHTFHEDCILPWLRMKSTCPVCRTSLLPKDESSQSGADGGGEGSSSRHHQNGPSPGNEDPPPIPGSWDVLD